MRKSCVWGDGVNREFQDIPEELKQLPNWLVWRFIDKGKEKPAKVPFSVHGGTAAVNDPATWGSFEEAAAIYEKGNCSGIGFVFTNTPFVGIDIDGCINPEAGEITPEAADILKMAYSYTEVSQSGRGFHIILKGKLPDGRRRNGSFEMYGDGSPRYFAITGNRWGDCAEISESQTAIEAVHKKYIDASGPKTSISTRGEVPPIALSDEQVLQLAMNAKNGGTFLALYHGEWRGKYGSQSEADIAFCNMLAFWTGRDDEQMDRLFRQSGLMRRKWDEKHGLLTYGEITITKAREDCREVYSSSAPQQKGENHCPAGNTCLDMVPMDKVEEKAVDWLVLDYIPKGQITILAGDGGSAKTSSWCNIAASISSGKPCFLIEDLIPLGFEEDTPKRVLFFSAEDSFEHVLKARLRLNGAKLENIFSIDIADERFENIRFNNPFLEQLIAKYRPALVIFDPIQAFIPPEVKMSERNAMRNCLRSLIGYGEKYGCTFLIIVHTNKQSGIWGRKRIADSADIWDIARSVLLAGETKEKGIRYISHEKCNYGMTGETVLFSIEDGRIKFKGYTSKKDKDFVMEADYKARNAPQREEAKEFILDFLKDGDKKVSELNEMARVIGYKDRTLERAKADLKKENKIDFYSTGVGRSKIHFIKSLMSS